MGLFLLFPSPQLWMVILRYYCSASPSVTKILYTNTERYRVGPERICFYCFGTRHTKTHTPHTHTQALNPSARHKIGMDVKSKPFKAAAKSSPEKRAEQLGWGIAFALGCGRRTLANAFAGTRTWPFLFLFLCAAWDFYWPDNGLKSLATAVAWNTQQTNMRYDRYWQKSVQ